MRGCEHSRIHIFGVTVPGMVSRIRTTTTPLDPEIRMFVRYLTVTKNRRPSTVEIYRDAAEKLAEYLHTEHEINNWHHVRRSHIEDFLAHVRETARGRNGKGASQGYLNQLYRSLRQYFKWWLDREADPGTPDPIARVDAPEVKVPPVAVVTDEQIAAMIESCQGPEFVQRRDLAILTLFFATGMRRKELAGLTVKDIHVGQSGGYVEISADNAKTGEPRTVGFGVTVADALDRYLAARSKHVQHGRPELWLGEKTKPPLTDTGVYQVIKRRGLKIGIKVYPHMLRHTWAHLQKLNDVPVDEVMAAAGWNTHQMYGRYGKSTASARAVTRAQTSSPLDRIVQDQFSKGRKK